MPACPLVVWLCLPDGYNVMSYSNPYGLIFSYGFSLSSLNVFGLFSVGGSNNIHWERAGDGRGIETRRSGRRGEGNMGQRPLDPEVYPVKEISGTHGIIWFILKCQSTRIASGMWMLCKPLTCNQARQPRERHLLAHHLPLPRTRGDLNGGNKHRVVPKYAWLETLVGQDQEPQLASLDELAMISNSPISSLNKK